MRGKARYLLATLALTLPFFVPGLAGRSVAFCRKSWASRARRRACTRRPPASAASPLSSNCRSMRSPLSAQLGAPVASCHDILREGLRGALLLCRLV